MVEFAVVPERIALLTIDLQNCFVEGELGAPDGVRTIERINRLAEACRGRGVPVFHIREILRDDGSNAGVFGEIHPFVLDGFFQKDAPTAAFHDSLCIEPSDIVP